MNKGIVVEREKQTVWITKYALTSGIEKTTAKKVYKNSIEVSGVTYSKGVQKTTQYFHGNEWHRTEEEAIARVRVMIANKIKSLEKSLEKMRKLQAKYA